MTENRYILALSNADSIKVDFEGLAASTQQLTEASEVTHRLAERIVTINLDFEQSIMGGSQEVFETFAENFRSTVTALQEKLQSESNALTMFLLYMQGSSSTGLSGAVLPITGLGGDQTGLTSSGGFHIGQPARPDIQHDNGFTEFCAINAEHDDCSSSASLQDRLNHAKYVAMLRGAQTLGHLDDGTEAYERYLFGDGEDWNFDYGEFVREDDNGRTAYTNIMLEAQRNAEILGQDYDNFNMTSDAFPIGGGDPRFPYPSTENWQKAIGAHQVWTSAQIEIDMNDAGQRVYTMELTYHAEDRYNFNPGMADIATGQLDRENGRFEVLGWANPFMSYGEITETVTWVEGSVTGSEYGENSSPRRDDRSVDRRGEVDDR